jgi:hypothetical protein
MALKRSGAPISKEALGRFDVRVVGQIDKTVFTDSRRQVMEGVVKS